jgi:hypothetical protein
MVPVCEDSPDGTGPKSAPEVPRNMALKPGTSLNPFIQLPEDRGLFISALEDWPQTGFSHYRF